MLDGLRPTPLRPPPRLGEHGRELLREAGLDDDAIDDLVARGVVTVPAAASGEATPATAATDLPAPGGNR